MEKKIVLKELHVAGFRGYQKRVLFTFTDSLAVFVGDNGKGKSSIGEAIVWAFTGRNITGGVKNINVMNNQSSMAYVQVKFEDQDGKLRTLERKLSSSTTIKMDDVTLTQKELEVYFPPATFLTLFNPMHFLQLEAPVARRLVAGMLKFATKDEVLEKMGDDAKNFLLNESFNADETNTYLEYRRGEIKGFDEQEKYLEGYVGKLKVTNTIPAKEVFVKEKELGAAVAAYEELLGKRQEVMADVTGESAATKEAREKLAYFEKSNDLPKIRTEYESSSKFTTSQIARVKRDIQRVQNEKPEQNVQLIQLEAGVQGLRTQYASELKNFNAVNARMEKYKATKIQDVCHSCGSAFVGEKKAKAEEQHKKELAALEQEVREAQETLSATKTKGTTQAGLIKAEKEAEKVKLAKFEETKKATLADLEKEHSELLERAKNEELQYNARLATFSTDTELLKKAIEESMKKDELNRKNAKEQQAKYAEQVQQQKQLIQGLENEKRTVVLQNSSVDTLIKEDEKRLKELQEMNDKVEKMAKKREHVGNQIYYMKQFVMKKVELMHQELAKHLFNVSIRLQRTTDSTGELKDCFDVYYDDKPLAICSLSEQMRAGLEIVGMLANSQGLNYPLFLDNAESITSYKTNAEQIIEVRVEKDKELTAISGAEIIGDQKPVQRRTQSVVVV